MSNIQEGDWGDFGSGGGYRSGDKKPGDITYEVFYTDDPKVYHINPKPPHVPGEDLARRAAVDFGVELDWDYYWLEREEGNENQPDQRINTSADIRDGDKLWLMVDDDPDKIYDNFEIDVPDM